MILFEKIINIMYVPVRVRQFAATSNGKIGARKIEIDKIYFKIRKMVY